MNVGKERKSTACHWMIICIALIFAVSAIGCGESETKRHTLGDEKSGAEALNDIFNHYFPEEAPNELIENDGEPVIAPWTHVLDDEIVERAILIDDESIVFPIEMQEELAFIELMNVIVSKHPEYPFLRRVVAIDTTDEELSYTTRDGELTDFMMGGKYSFEDEEDIEEDEWYENPDDDPNYSFPEEGDDDDELPDYEPGGFGDLRQYHEATANENELNDGEFTQRRQASSTSFGTIPRMSGGETKNGSRISAKFEVRTSNPTARIHRKLDVDISFGGGATMCNEFRNAQQGVIPGWVWDTEVNSTILTLAWALKWAGATTYCHREWTPCNSLFEYENYDHWGEMYFQPREAFREALDDFSSYVSRERLSRQYYTSYWRNRNFSANEKKNTHYIRLAGTGSFSSTVRSSVLNRYWSLARARGWPHSQSYTKTMSLGSINWTSGVDSDTKSLIIMLQQLWKTPSTDDLHWIQMAPVIGQQYCQGVANTFNFGAGLRLTIDHSAEFKVELMSGQTTTIKENIEWYKAALSKTYILWVGWVPVVLTGEFGWKSQLSSSLEAGVEYVIKYPKRRARLEFYHGVDYNSARASGDKLRYQDLRDYNGATPGLFLFEDHPDHPNAKIETIATPQVKAQLEFKTGPRFMIRLYGTVGVGMQMVLKATAAISTGVEFSNSSRPRPVCKAGIKAGASLEGVGEIKVPLCSADACSLDGSIVLWDSCDTTVMPFCTEWEVPIRGCGSNNSGGAGNGSRYTWDPAAANYLTDLPQSETEPAGVNDVEGMFELDALFLQRGGRKIVPVRVEGIANCTPENGTVERGCPELLWYADFKECDPDNWDKKVALIPDLSQFKVQFYEDAEPGDILRVIRQAVPANRLNADGERCLVSGAMDFYLGVIGEDGQMTTGDTPIGYGIYNTNDYYIAEEHLTSTYVPRAEQYWPTSSDDNTFGAEVGDEPEE